MSCRSLVVFVILADGQVAREDLFGGAGHLHLVVIGPTDLEVAPGQLNSRLTADAQRQRRNDSRGAGAGAAGQCLAAATLPDP